MLKKILKRIGLGLVAIIVLLGVAYTVLHVRAETVLNEAWDVPVQGVTVSPDSAAVARAEHLVHSLYGCASCHGDDLAGRVFIDGAPGRFVASNLTPAGVGARYTDADWDRAIRHGVGMDGRELPMMNARLFRHLADEDLAALVAYLQALPPVQNDLPDEEVRPLGRVLIGLGVLPPAPANFDHAERPPQAVRPDTTAEYGGYLASLSCVECHGNDLRGGPHPDPAAPEAPTLQAAAGWPRAAFVEAMRTGVAPGGRAMNAEWMPWPVYARLTDAELAALHAHLQTALAPSAP